MQHCHTLRLLLLKQHHVHIEGQTMFLLLKMAETWLIMLAWVMFLASLNLTLFVLVLALGTFQEKEKEYGNAFT